MAVSQSLTLTESNVVISSNTSKVRILWQSTQTGESWNGYTRTAKYYVSINGGAEKEYLVNYTLPQNETATIVDTTITVNHKTDGSGSVKVRTWMDTSISAGVVTQSKTLNLTTIARASTIDALSCNTAYFNGTMTYKYTPKSSSYYNRCNIALNLDGEYTAVKTINLGQKAASQQTATVTLSESELSIIYNKLPSAKKGTLRFTLRTYSDSGYSTQVGDAPYKEVTLTIPNISETQPTATMTLTPVSSLSSPFNTLYIKGKSKVTVALTGGEGKYGASITSYKVSVAGKSGDAPYTSGYLVNPGSVTITGTVTDSRGYSRKYTKTITVVDYSPPQIIPVSGESEVIAARCDSGGTLSDTGTYLKIKAKRSFTKVNISGANKNLCYIRYRYKKEGGSFSSWTTILATNAASDEITTGALLSGALSVTSSYIVQVQAVDSIGEAGTTVLSLPTERVYMHKASSINSLGIGTYVSESNAIDIADEINIYGRVYGLGKARVAIQSGEDVNNFLDFGVYAVTSNAIAGTIANIPVQSAGRLIVSSGNGSGKRSGTYTYILQEYITFNGYYHCFREAYTSDDASAWYFNKWEIRSSRYWINLGLSDEVSVSSSNMGRFTNGTCCYRVVNENHVHVAFNCAFTYKNAPITVSGNEIPSPYKPARNVYALCPVNGRAVARIFVNSSGAVRIDYVQNMASAETTESYTVNWIDGYIDYWV